MSFEFRTLDQIAEDSATCPTCGARPGQRCRTASGRDAATHQPRIDPVREGFAAGYEEGSNP